MPLFDGTPLQQPVTCERCTKPLGQCSCPRDRASGKVLAPADQPLRVRREKRHGKFVTVVTGFAPRSDTSDDLPAILKDLKARLGAGGTTSSEPATGKPLPNKHSGSAAHVATLEFQGDHRDRLVEHFSRLGYPTKPAGG